MMCYSTIYFKHANQENNSKRLILGSFAERSLTEFFDRRVRNISKEVEVLLGSVYEDTYESLIDLCGILLRQDLLCFVKFATKTLLLVSLSFFLRPLCS